MVAESVVVIKKLLQMQPEKHSDIIKHMAKLTDNIQVKNVCQKETGSIMGCCAETRRAKGGSPSNIV